MELEKIKELVENYYGISLELKSRQRLYIEARYIYFYLCRNFTNFSLAKIGESVGKDHATVLNGLKKLDGLRQWYRSTNENFYELYSLAKQMTKEEETKEPTLEQLVKMYNKLLIDHEILKQQYQKLCLDLQNT